MEDALRQLGLDVQANFHIIYLGLIWIRILACFAIIPFLVGKPAPRYMVVGISFVLALFIYRALAPETPIDYGNNLLHVFVLFMKEAFLGISMGLVSGAIFYGFQAAGAMIDNQRGVSMARLLIPQLGEQGSLSGAFLLQLATVIFLSLGGHRLFFHHLFMSYKRLPVLGFPVSGPEMFGMIDIFVDVTALVLYMSIQLAAPVMIAIFLADIILGIANRIAPQINVWELGFNVKGYLGTVLLFVSLTLIAGRLNDYGVEMNQDLDRFIEAQIPNKTSPEIIETFPQDGIKTKDGALPPVITLPNDGPQ